MSASFAFHFHDFHLLSGVLISWSNPSPLGLVEERELENIYIYIHRKVKYVDAKIQNFHFPASLSP